MKAPSIETALRIYTEYTEIGTSEIKELFDCKQSSASSLKRKAKAKMAEKQIRCFIPSNVNVEAAYEAWGINIELYERKYQTKQRLKIRREEV